MDVPENGSKRKEERYIPRVWVAAIYWLAKKIHLHPDDLGEILEILRSGDSSLYQVRRIQKRDGTWKEICIPVGILKTAQRQINTRILRFLRPADNVFGFSGGNIEDALKPHLANKSLLCVDIVDAFPTITYVDVQECLTWGRKIQETGWGKKSKVKVIEYGKFSWYVAMILAELVTFKGRLRRGQPTSPRIFDLVCEPLDKSLQKLAQNVGGKYTRYADNLFFSLPSEKFPPKIRNAILKKIEGKRRRGPKFKWHKLRIVRMDGKAVRALGLNIINGEIHNTRSFKRRVRLAIHHVEWLLDHNMPYKEAWLRLQGQMQFARKLPPKLKDAYDALKHKQRIT